MSMKLVKAFKATQEDHADAFERFANAFLVDDEIVVHLGAMPMNEMGYKPLGHVPTNASHLLPPVKVTYVDHSDEKKTAGNDTRATTLPHRN